MGSPGRSANETQPHSHQVTRMGQQGFTPLGSLQRPRAQRVTGAQHCDAAQLAQRVLFHPPRAGDVPFSTAEVITVLTLT